MEFDEYWFKSVGLTVSEQRLLALGTKVYDELEIRIGTFIARHLTDDQMNEFNTLPEDEGGSARITWLDKNYPGHNKVVRQEEKKLHAELKEAIDKEVVIDNWSKRRKTAD